MNQIQQIQEYNSYNSSRYGSNQKLDDRLYESSNINPMNQGIQNEKAVFYEDTITDLGDKVKDLTLQISNLTQISNKLIEDNSFLNDQLSKINKINTKQLKNPSRKQVHVLALEQENKSLVEQILEYKKKCELQEILVEQIDSGELEERLHITQDEIQDNKQYIKQLQFEDPDHFVILDDLEKVYAQHLDGIKEKIKQLEQTNKTLEQQEDTYQEQEQQYQEENNLRQEKQRAENERLQAMYDEEQEQLRIQQQQEEEQRKQEQQELLSQQSQKKTSKEEVRKPVKSFKSNDYSLKKSNNNNKVNSNSTSMKNSKAVNSNNNNNMQGSLQQHQYALQKGSIDSNNNMKNSSGSRIFQQDSQLEVLQDDPQEGSNTVSKDNSISQQDATPSQTNNNQNSSNNNNNNQFSIKINSAKESTNNANNYGDDDDLEQIEGAESKSVSSKGGLQYQTQKQSAFQKPGYNNNDNSSRASSQHINIENQKQSSNNNSKVGNLSRGGSRASNQISRGASRASNQV